MLGIIDSGLGGLSVLRYLRTRYPRSAITYLADQANAPLGVRPAQELSALFQRYVTYFDSIDVATIVMGSNTLCAVSHVHGWPAGNATIIDIIGPTVRAIAATAKRKIAVLATAATARSRAFGNAIRAAVADAQVQEIAASELVEVVESGAHDGAESDALVGRICSQIDPAIELVVLGCTHFPWLQRAIADAVGPARPLLDPAVAMVQELESQTASGSAIPDGGGATSFLTTGDPETFRRHIERLMGELAPTDRVRPVPPFA